MKRDLVRVRNEWLKQWGRFPKLDERKGWTSFAESEGLSSDEEEMCWTILSGPARQEGMRVQNTLRRIFGEGQSWAGTGGSSFGGVPVSPGLAPQTQAQIRDQGPNTTPASGFGFGTRAAERVWMFAQMLILSRPLASPDELIRQALVQTGISINEMTPEDIQMLLMAIEAAQNGVPQSSVRTVGGPSRGDFARVPMESRQLSEFQGGMAFSGPEPGKLDPTSPGFPETMKASMFGPSVSGKDPKAYKDKGKKMRRALRMLSTWLAQRQDPSHSPEET